MTLDLRAVEATLGVGCNCVPHQNARALLAHCYALRAAGRKLWSKVRAEDRAGLVMAAHDFAAVLAQATDEPQEASGPTLYDQGGKARYVTDD